MLKIIIPILIFAIIIGFLNKKFNWFSVEIYTFIMVIPIMIASVVTIVISCIVINNMISLNSIDQQIDIIDEQNQKISEEIKFNVLFHMESENKEYNSLVNEKEIDNSNFIILTQQFPELKSNELISKNIEIYNSNEKKLTKLKIDKVEKQASITFWW